jgi:anaerobic selenocysteine-containing dehydrogenase
MPLDPTTPHEPPPREPAPAEADFSRRDALTALGLAGAAVIAGGVVGHKMSHPTATPAVPLTSLAMAKPYVRGAEHFGRHEERWISTSCGQCTAGCGVRVRVVEGRAVRIEGNDKNPLNRGGIGPRGLAALQVLYDPDRITSPLVRENGRLVPLPWDRAIGLLTEKLAAARARGPERVLVMTGREYGFMHDLWERFAQAFGTPSFVDGRPSRSSTLAQATLATLGTFDVPTFDWAKADYVLSLGAGMLEDSCQLVYLARAAADVHGSNTGKRTTIVQACPTFDLSAQVADLWIRIKPGASAAIAYGIAHVLLRDGLHDARWVKDHSTGFDAFATFVSEKFAPARVAEIAGVPVKTIERLAHSLAARRPSFVYADERSFSFSNGWETALAVLSLNALLGALGPLVRIEPRPPYAPWAAVTVDDAARAGIQKPRIDGAGSTDFPFARAVHETIPDAIAASPPDVLLLDHANPAFARKQPERWKKALGAVPFVVSFSPFRDETVDQLAHLVLPDHTFLERWDDAASAPSVGIPVAGVRRPVVEHVLDTRSTGDVLIDVARALGGSVAQSFPWGTARDALEARLRGLFEARRGSIVETKESAFFTRLYADGFWSDRDAPPVALAPFAFRPEYADATWEGDTGQFPLKLVVYRPLGYAEGSGANLPWLRQLRPRPDTVRTAGTLVAIHPDAAPGAQTGDAIEVTSAFGTVQATARIDARLAPDVVAFPMGGGHEAYGRFAKGRGANAMRLVAPGPAPHTGANMLSATRVRVALVGKVASR